MDEATRSPLAGANLTRDRDVMNLLDQLELYTLRIGGKQATQSEYWLFVYKSMKSGLLMTKTLESHLLHKLRSLGLDPVKSPSS